VRFDGACRRFIRCCAPGRRADRHRGDGAARCAPRAGHRLTPTQGWPGMPVEDTAARSRRRSARDRFANVRRVRQAIDRQPGAGDVQWRSVHRARRRCPNCSTKSEIFETGIKAMTCSCRWSARQGGTVRRRGRPARRCCSRDDPQHDRASEGGEHFLRNRGACREARSSTAT